MVTSVGEGDTSKRERPHPVFDIKWTHSLAYRGPAGGVTAPRMGTGKTPLGDAIILPLPPNSA